MLFRSVDVYELNKLKRAPAFELYPLDLFLVEQDIIASRQLETLDDLVMIDRADAGDDLFILDRLSARFVDLAKADRRARFGRGIDFDGNRYQSEPNLSLTINAYGHPQPRSSYPDPHGVDLHYGPFATQPV